MRDFFIDRPKAALVLALLLLLLGGVSIYTLPITQFPAITPPSVSVSATYTGADAITVEEGVTTPIEVQINGVPGLDYLTSNSTDNGASSIEATFDLGTDIDIAALEVQNRVALAEPSLPEQVRRLGGHGPQAKSGSVHARGPGLARGHARREVPRELLQHLRQGRDAARGRYRGRLRAHERLRDAALARSRAHGPARDHARRGGRGPARAKPPGGGRGRRAAPQTDAQAFEYTVFLDGRLETEAEFADVIVRNDPASGSLIRVSDIGRVELGTFTYGNLAITNGSRPRC